MFGSTKKISKRENKFSSRKSYGVSNVLLIGLQKTTGMHMEFMHVTEFYLITKVLFGVKLLLLRENYTRLG